MKRIGTASLSICAALGLFTFVACGSGDADPADGGNAGTSSNAGSTGTSGGSGGTTGTTAGTTGTTAGTTGTTGGSAGTTSTTGGSAGTTSTTASVCTTTTSRMVLVSEGFIDDLETEAQFAGWYAFADDGNMEPHAVTREADGATGTGFSVKATATGITTPTGGGYGAGFGYGLINPVMEKCIDVSAFDGISFWAKGTSGADGVLTFQAVVPAMQPARLGGDCTDADEMADKCFLHPKAAITLTAEWAQYTIAWADLMGPSPIVDNRIIEVNWITAGTAYEVWMDEVALYAGTPPAGPVGMPGAGGMGAGGAGG